MRLIGEFRAKIDSKGRFRLPSDLLEQLEQEEGFKFVVSRGYEEYINLYPENVWDEILDEYEKGLDPFDPDDTRTLRKIYAGSKRVETDSSSRISLPVFLQEYALLNKDIVLLCMSNRVEIWSQEQFDKNNKLTPSEFEISAREAARKRERRRNGE